MANATDIFIQMSEKKNAIISTTTNDNDENGIATTAKLNDESIVHFGRTDSYTDHGLAVSSSSKSKYNKPPPNQTRYSNNNNNGSTSYSASGSHGKNNSNSSSGGGGGNLLLVRPNEIPVYLQRSSFQIDDVLNCFRDGS